MTTSGEENGDTFALRMVEMQKSTAACNELKELSKTVSALLDELKGEAFELCKRHTAYTSTAMIFETLFMNRFSQHVPTYLAIASKFQTVLTRINTLHDNIKECEQKHVAQLDAWINAMPPFVTVEIVLNMTVDDHKAKIKQLEEHTKKVDEVKTCVQNAITDWSNAKEGVYADLNYCILHIDNLCECLFQQAF